MHYIKAYAISLGIMGALFFGLFVWWQKGALESHSSPHYLLGALTLAIVLVGVNVLQLYKNSEDAAYIATKLIQDMLLSSRELFFELFRGSPVPYLVIEKNATITSTNTAAVRLFGVEVNGLDGKNFLDFVKSDDTPHAALFPEKVYRGVTFNDEEIQIVRPDGEERWVLCSSFSFVDGENIRRGMITLVDVTKQKQIDQAKTEFVSLASHQLRTPIATMSWNLELFLMKYEKGLPEEAHTYVAKSMESLRQMNLLVGDFLNASRFELGTLHCQKEIIALQVFIDTVIAEHKATAEAKNITIQTIYDPTLVSLSSDPRLLQMVVNNLVSNAVKYTPSQGTVTVEIKKTQEGIAIVVSDTGMGIPKSEQSRLFSKIFRASNAIASVPDGTGLGLYIAYQALKVLGGTIVCESEEKRGTMFTVTLPQ